jgi:hypothetical protein
LLDALTSIKCSRGLSSSSTIVIHDHTEDGQSKIHLK